MPAQRLASESVTVRQFDVVGLDSAELANFVAHVAFSAELRPDHRPPAGLPLSHMQPPLLLGQDSRVVTTVGSIPLSAGEVQRVAVFLEETRSEYEAARVRRLNQYVIRPHTAPVLSADGTVVCHRYSCAGFVIRAYDEADIHLLDLDEARLPMVSLDVVVAAYAPFRNRLSDPTERARYGLDGGGPWPVLLAGYVLNALARTEAEIRTSPYQPQPGDEFFPPRRD